VSKMKLDVYSKDGSKKGQVDVPSHLTGNYRPDLIKRAFLALRSILRQPYGAKVGAGMRASAELSRRRRDYRGSYGHGISRVPRKILSRRGTRMTWVAAVAPGTVGGRRAHAPKADKIFEEKINRKERRLALQSAIAASLDRSIVEVRGHKVPENYPFAITQDFESIDKTKDALLALKTLGFESELERAYQKTIRAGRGTMRGRIYKGKKSLLIVVSDNCSLKDALSNVPGIDVARYDELNAVLLAPGSHAGRAVLFTETALSKMNEKKQYAIA
jgi:large subunit ribosomal protein L4e